METLFYSMFFAACVAVPVLIAVYWHATHRVDIHTLKQRLENLDRYKKVLDDRHERLTEQQQKLNKWHDTLIQRADELDKRTQKLLDMTKKLMADA
jgi:hypothetical protein